MASVEKRTEGKKVTYRIRLSEGEHPDRPRIGLGAVTKKEANAASVHIENLVNHCNAGGSLATATADWVAKIRPAVRKRLEALGLVETACAKGDKTSLFGWIDGYIKGRTDAKSGTITAMKQAANNLYKFAGKDSSLKNFTANDADNFRRYLLNINLAESTTRRRCKYAKQFFTAAVKARIVLENPFDGVPTAGRADTSKQRFIDRGTIQAVIDACPNAEWRLIFALARYAGLRIPSELWGLTWDGVNWDKKRFTVYSPKTEHHDGKESRICPIFPELEPYLLEVFEQSKPGQKKVITIYNEENCNLRTQADRIVQRAGVQSWPKLFINLRSSRETELVESFPVHVVTSWLGNSPEIAHKHYLQVTESHFESAVENWGTKRGQAGAVTGEIGGKGSQGKKQGTDVSLLNAAIYEDIKKGTNLCDSPLVLCPS